MTLTIGAHHKLQNTPAHFFSKRSKMLIRATILNRYQKYCVYLDVFAPLKYYALEKMSPENQKKKQFFSFYVLACSFRKGFKPLLLTLTRLR